MIRYNRISNYHKEVNMGEIAGAALVIGLYLWWKKRKK